MSFHRQRAEDTLEAIRATADHVKDLNLRLHRGAGDAQALHRAIGRANAELGVALKIADVHATLAVAEALAVEVVAAARRLTNSSLASSSPREASEVSR